MIERPMDPDAAHRARFDDIEFQREIEDATEQLERNTRSLTDVFIEFMERGDQIEVAVGAHRWTGFVAGVGPDVVTIDDGRARVDVAVGAMTVTTVSSLRSAGGSPQMPDLGSSLIARLRSLAGTAADLTVEIGGATMPTLTGRLRSVAETHVEIVSQAGARHVVPLSAIGFVSSAGRSR